MIAVEVKDLTHSINNKKILNNINFNLNKDSISCILGPSGSGKTTLLKLIAGLEKVQSGKIIINGEEVSSTAKHLHTEKRKIGFLFQDYALFPHLTVKENLRFPTNAKNSTNNVDEIIELIKLPNSLDKYPHELSGGEQQRVAIARALINNPSILFADEPTGNLDSQTGMKVLDIFKRLNENGQTIILITHENEVASAAKRIIHIKDGNISNDEIH